jgi:hypothetical protein
MNKDLETRLRDALRPVAPSADFTERLIAQVNAQRGWRASRPLWWLGGVAASLLLAVGVQQHMRAQRDLAEGLEARRQVLQALHMTGQKLDLAYEAVRHESSSLYNAEPGA